MSAITLERKVSGVLTDADLGVTLEDSAGVYGIKRVSTDAVEVAAGTAVTHSATGTYTYDTSLLDPTLSYIAAWRIETTDWGVQYVYELIPAPARGLCTLADIERETAIRLGPYARATVGSDNSDLNFAINKRKTSLDIGGYENLYVLRRGYMTSGAPIGGFVDDDRVRIVVTFTHDDGLFEMDRTYTNAPVEGEDVEFHYLDPENELRPLVLSALSSEVRLMDRFAVRLTTALAEQDITSYAPWIQEKGQIRELSSAFSNSVFVPFLVDWWDDYLRDGNLWVKMGPVPYPNSLLIDHWRWASTLVNGAYSSDGPTDDADILHVNVNYAAAKAHERAFVFGSVRPRIMEASRQGLYMTQAEVKEEAMRQADRYFKPTRRRTMVPGPGLDANLVVNGPTLAN